MKTLNRLAQFLISSALFGFVLYCFFLRAAYPGLYLDEGIYVGAAEAVRHGDIFLSRFWFDKLPLAVYLLTGGIFAFGTNGFGFHFSGLVFSIANYFLLIRLYRDFSGCEGWSLVVFRGLAAAILVSPLFLIHGPSAFTDPFQIFFLLLFVRELKFVLTGERGPSRAYLYFMLALFCKHTAIVWFPFVLGLWWEKGATTPRAFGNQLRDFFRRTAFLWGLLIFYGFVYKQKFAFVGSYAYNSSESLTQPFFYPTAIFRKLVDWWTVSRGELWPWPTLVLFGSASLGLTVLLIWGKDRRASRWLAVPFLVHVVFLFLGPARPFGRYLMLLILQGSLVIAYGVRLNQRRFWLVPLLTGAVLATIHFDFSRYELAPVEFAKSGQQVAEEVPAGSVVHTDNYWLLSAYRDFDRVFLDCGESPCFSNLTGSAPGTRQFMLRREPKGEWPAHQLLVRGPYLKISQCDLDWSTLRNPEEWKMRLRLNKIPGELTITLTETVFRTRYGEWETIEGYPARIQFQYGGGLPVESLELTGKLVVAERFRKRDSMELPKDTLGFRVETMRVAPYAADFSVLAPLLWKGYFIPFSGVQCRR